MGSETGWPGLTSVVPEQVGIVFGCNDGLSLDKLICAFPEANWCELKERGIGGDVDMVVIVVSEPDAASEISRLRARWGGPLVAASVSASDDEEFRCLAAGADGYIDLNESPQKLVMRLRALMRRARAGMGRMAIGRGAVQRGPLTLDPPRRSVHWRGEPVHVSETEFRLLSALAARPGFVKSRAQLLDEAYGEDLEVDDRTIDSHIKRLRKKLRVLDPEFSAIRTYYGLGYSFVHAP